MVLCGTETFYLNMIIDGHLIALRSLNFTKLDVTDSSRYPSLFRFRDIIGHTLDLTHDRLIIQRKHISDGYSLESSTG